MTDAKNKLELDEITFPKNIKIKLSDEDGPIAARDALPIVKGKGFTGSMRDISRSKKGYDVTCADSDDN
jgi:hypothetical protein